MSKRMSPCKWPATALALAVFGAVVAPAGAQTDLSVVPLPTYSLGTAVDIKPNILFVLDDSGSMDWNFLPDWANARPPNYRNLDPNVNDGGRRLPLYMRLNADFNGLAYNPAVRYQPPVRFDAATGQRVNLPSMTSAATSAWTSVPRDGYGVQSTTRDDLTAYAPTTYGGSIYPVLGTGAPFFYTTIAGEFCDSPSMRNCTATSTATGNFAYRAALRWCDSRNLTNCRATQNATFDFPRMPAPRVSRISFSGLVDARIGGITVGGVQIMSGPTAAFDDVNALAAAVRDRINDCFRAQTGNCGTVGYQAYLRNGTDGFITILAPGLATDTPAVTVLSGTVTRTATAFARGQQPLYPFGDSPTTVPSDNPVPGENLVTIIRPGVTSYPYPGSATKAATRTDCAGTTCTYDEEMTNFANWYAYYSTRMQLMKTATSIAFSSLDSDADLAAGTSRFRIGYMSINNNTGTDFANIDDFRTTQKVTWYSKLFAATPNNSTPLREALSKAGSLYAGKYNGQNLNGVAVVDPLQYSCQRNFTILSTDGYWNGNAGFKLDGSSAIGNADAALPRPYNDGAGTEIQTRTSQLRVRNDTQSAERGILWTRTWTLWTRQGTSCSGSTCTWGGWDPVTGTGTCEIDSSGGTRRQCEYRLAQDWTQATAACTNAPRQTSTANNAVYAQARDCEYRWQAAVPTSTCTPALTSGNFTNLAVWRNCTVVQGTEVDATATCTPSGYGADGRNTVCSYADWTAWNSASSCTAQARSGTAPFTVLLARECQTNTFTGVSNSLADVAAYYFNTDLRAPSGSTAAADTTGTCTGPIISPATTATDLCTNNVPVVAGSRNTNTKQHMVTHGLALGVQGLMVYSPYQNDLNGERTYVPDYWNQKSGDFFDVANGTTANPSAGICSWMASGRCTWPTPSEGSQANIDDLWHAAVNGHGTYFSARDPASLSESLRAVLNEITKTPNPGTAAAAASSNPNVTSADNYVFSSSYMSLDWYGELIMQRIQTDGTLGQQQWSAMRLLDCATTPWAGNRTYQAGDVFQAGGKCWLVNAGYTSGATFDASRTTITEIAATAPNGRTIYTASNGALTPFTWDGLDTTQRTWFTTPHINPAAGRGLSQFCATGPTCLTATARAAAEGAPLVDFLRGDRTNEGAYFRTRKRVLGDIVSSEARYVKQAQFNYADPGYADFKASTASRAGTVYVGSNGGMLHAFNAETGIERWAFVPPSILPEMHRLADTDYTNRRRFFVDGTPEVGDICPSTSCAATEWKTILVGGLNLGGRAFYALDVTDPANPRFMWEFTNAQLGFSYSNPRITKLSNGTWVVIVASGYNNADGVGRLFVLNANTGALISTISTGVGTATEPSGLARISARAPTANTNNTVAAVYGGDLLGNVWRFDVNGNVGSPGVEAQLLVQLQDPSGNPQSVTARPTVGSINGTPIVMVGTGRYLGITDLPTTQVQSLYVFKDKLDATSLPTPRSVGSNFVQQTLNVGTCPTGTPASICTAGQTVRTISASTVDWAIRNGWYLDLPAGGERAITDATLALGTLAFTTVDPQSSEESAISCTRNTPPTSRSFLYYIDYATGGAVGGTNNVVGVFLGAGVATRPSIFRNQDGTVRALIRISGTTGGEGSTDMGGTVQKDIPTGGASGTQPNRRSWRILNGEN